MLITLYTICPLNKLSLKSKTSFVMIFQILINHYQNFKYTCRNFRIFLVKKEELFQKTQSMMKVLDSMLDSNNSIKTFNSRNTLPQFRYQGKNNNNNTNNSLGAVPKQYNMSHKQSNDQNRKFNQTNKQFNNKSNNQFNQSNNQVNN